MLTKTWMDLYKKTLLTDSDNGLMENSSDEGFISSENSQNSGILQQVQNDQSFDDTVVYYEQEDSLENPLKNPYSYTQEREERNPVMLGKESTISQE